MWKCRWLDSSPSRVCIPSPEPSLRAENTLPGCWELSQRWSRWQSVLHLAEGRGMPLQKAGSGAKNWERLATAKQVSPLSLVLSLYLEGLCLRQGRGTCMLVAGNWLLAIEKLSKCKTENLRSQSEKVNKILFLETLAAKDTLCASLLFWAKLFTVITVKVSSAGQQVPVLTLSCPNTAYEKF